MKNPKQYIARLIDLLRALAPSQSWLTKCIAGIRTILGAERHALVARLAAIKQFVLRLVSRLRRNTPAPLPKQRSAKTITTEARTSDRVAQNTEALHNHILNNYRLRYNTLTETTEICRTADDTIGDYQPLTRRLLNTIVIDAQRQGIYCWDRDVQRILLSEYIPDVNPIRAYIAALPQWDGVDRLTPLAERVSQDGVWVMGFGRWMTAMVAQWMGRMGRTANALAPILVSAQQGMNKSTFCRMLMPPALRDYYLDRFDLTSVAQQERKMSLFGLINMDEFDRYDRRQMPMLKMLMQELQPTLRRAYTQQWAVLPRLASFIGTSNQRELLTDETGSRRFLCVEVTAPIDCTPIDYDQLYAQLYHRVVAGERTYLSAAEEREVEAHNAAFQILRPEAEVFLQHYEVSDTNATDVADCEWLSATAIYLDLRQRCPSVMRHCTVNTLARTMLSLGARRQHRRDGNAYLVRRRQNGAL